MKKITLIFILSGCLVSLMGQTGGTILEAKDEKGTSPSDSSYSTVFMEFFGPALISFNAEVTAPIRKNQFITFGAGLGFNRQPAFLAFLQRRSSNVMTAIPGHFTYNFGKIHCLETGINTAFILANNSSPLFISPIVGYRMHQNFQKGGFMFRFYIQPPIRSILSGGNNPTNTIESDYLILPMGFSLGISL